MSNVVISSNAGPEGFLTVSKVYLDGSKELVFEEKKNVITLPSKLQMLASVYSTSLTPDPVSTLQVGIGGTIDPAGLYPKPVTSALTSLFSSNFTINTTYSLNTAVPSITYLADLPPAWGNGNLINEAGLFRTSGAMFNIKTFPGIPKTSEFSIHFEWTIKMP